MPTITSAQISIGQSFDFGMAQETAREIMQKLGFAVQPAENVVLVVTELASNLVRRARHGTLALRLMDSGERVGIEVETEDHGPGRIDPAQAFQQGEAAGGGLEAGLETAKRLMDETEISSTAGLGTRILCRRWLHPKAYASIVHPWQIGVATRPFDQSPANGDAFVIHEGNGHLLAGVIDGLGHGELAQQAALAAQAYVQSHYELPLDELFSGASRACHGTRGVVMALARFESPTTITFASLGNVEMRAWSGTERFDFAVQRGFLGAQESHVEVRQHRWEPNWMLVLHSDGLRAQWQWSDFPGLELAPPQAVANQLLKVLAKEHDDATVVAVKCWSAAP
jgi:anti-sigma regulatory factor (Ser/Thr protein kinase)/serine/threonine protein phosphatase PrpC